jgi:hypothetical protein
MTSLAKIPASLDLAVTVGSDLILAVTVNENSAPYDFDGSTIATSIIGLTGVVSVTNFTTTTLNNVLTLTLPAASTTALGSGTFRYTVNVTKDTVNPWLAGALTIVQPGLGAPSAAATTLTLQTSPTVQLDLAVGFGVIPDAEAVPFTAADPLTETNVQDALTELATAVQARIPTVKSSVFIEDNTTETQVTQNVAAKVAGIFQAGPMCMACTYNGNRITYNGARNTRVMAVASVDIDGPNNITYLIELRRNGQPVDGLRSKVRKGVGVAAGSIVGHIPLTTGDFIELWITNTTNSDNPVVSDATFALMN